VAHDVKHYLRLIWIHKITLVHLEKLSSVLWELHQHSLNLHETLFIEVEVFIVCTCQSKCLHVLVKRHHSTDVLEAILLNLEVAKIKLNYFVVCVESPPLKQVDGDAEQESTIGGKDGAKHTCIDQGVGILKTTLSFE